MHISTRLWMVGCLCLVGCVNHGTNGDYVPPDPMTPRPAMTEVVWQEPSSAKLFDHSDLHRRSFSSKENTPASIMLYTHPAVPKRPYRIIGTANIARYNLLGLRRHENTMQAMMRQAAASVGGDALIHVSRTKQGGMQGQVIVFEKVLV